MQGIEWKIAKSQLMSFCFRRKKAMENLKSLAKANEELISKYRAGNSSQNREVLYGTLFVGKIVTCPGKGNICVIEPMETEPKQTRYDLAYMLKASCNDCAGTSERHLSETLSEYKEKYVEWPLEQVRVLHIALSPTVSTLL